MAQRYFQQTFTNGMTLLGEHMPAMQSMAMTFVLPAGSSTDPADAQGCASVLSDLVLRGAGARDSRQLTDYLDSLGLQRSGNVGVHHTRFGCAALAARVMDGLRVYADIIRRPHLPSAGFDSARDLALQALEGVEDEPRQKLMIQLRQRHFPEPYGRNSMGRKEHLEKLDLARCKADYAQRYNPRGSFLAFAGNLDFAALVDLVQELFGDWQPIPEPTIVMSPPPGNYHHEHQKSEQTNIGIAYPCIPETHEDYYAARMAVEILGGGTSSRLFTEVREKRGLVYGISASYGSLKDCGSIMGFAGTSNDRAQATLDAFLAELRRLSAGVTADELDRAKIGLKASTIMSSESTSARCGAIAHDFFMRGRIRTLEQVKQAIDETTLQHVNDYLRRNVPGPFTIVTVGPRELSLPKLS